MAVLMIILLLKVYSFNRINYPNYPSIYIYIYINISGYKTSAL